MHHCAVSLFKFNRETGAYAGAAPGTLGLAIVGGGITYQLLCYDSQKQHVLKMVMGKEFSPSPQPNNYVSFADPQGTAWSLLFKTEQDGAAFLRYAALVRAHQAVHGTDSADTDSAVGTFDTLAGKADQPELVIGDAAGVTYSAWELQGGAGAAQPPHAAVAQPSSIRRPGGWLPRVVALAAPRVKAIYYAVRLPTRGGGARGP